MRRGFGAAAGIALAQQLNLLDATAAEARPRSAARRGEVSRGAYGPLYPTRDQATGLELLMLPRGFEYITYGWTGDPMDDGAPTPDSHDGMAAFRGADGKVRLVRNHERGGTSGAFASGMTYNPLAEGGTTTLLFDPDRGEFLGSRPSLAGTIRNCAGGPTPWGTWLSCEETTVVNGSYRHGYVFEVPADGVATGAPLTAMGRFSHEAAAVDPATGNVYLTEDATPSGLYRFVPKVPGRLSAGGRLEMLRIGTSPTQTYADSAPRDYGVISWVEIPTPDPGPLDPPTVSQGIARGGAQFERLEGIWFDEGKIYFVSTSGGPQRGQVFELDPATDRLRLIFHSPGPDVLDSPDNICFSPAEEWSSARTAADLSSCMAWAPTASSSSSLGIPRCSTVNAGSTATSPARSGAVRPSSPRRATGCSPTSSRPVSPWRSPVRGDGERSEGRAIFVTVIAGSLR